MPAQVFGSWATMPRRDETAAIVRTAGDIGPDHRRPRVLPSIDILPLSRSILPLIARIEPGNRAETIACSTWKYII